MAIAWNPVDYSRSSAAQQTWARELIEKLGLRGDETLLDIGCGDGKVTAEIAARLPRGSVLGIDSSREMVGFAARACRGNSGSQEANESIAIPFPQHKASLRFAVCDARSMEFEDEFDVVFSNATLHWIIDHRPVLHGIARALRPGGRALLQMGGRGNAAGILSLMDSMPEHPRWARYLPEPMRPYGWHGPEEYREWLIEAGLSPVRVELIEKDMAQPGVEGLASWIRTTWMPYTHRIPEDVREEFVSEIAQMYANLHPPDREGLLHVRMVRLEVEAALYETRLPNT